MERRYSVEEYDWSNDIVQTPQVFSHLFAEVIRLLENFRMRSAVPLESSLLTSSHLSGSENLVSSRSDRYRRVAFDFSVSDQQMNTVETFGDLYETSIFRALWCQRLIWSSREHEVLREIQAFFPSARSVFHSEVDKNISLERNQSQSSRVSSGSALSVLQAQRSIEEFSLAQHPEPLFFDLALTDTLSPTQVILCCTFGPTCRKALDFQFFPLSQAKRLF